MPGKFFRHAATYQGLPCQATQYSRSEGLSPETGWVDIDFEDLGKIDIEPRAIPWRGSSGLEWDGNLSIQAWAKMKSSMRASVTAPAPITAPSGGGLCQFGDLVLTTHQEGAGGEGSEYSKIVYKDVQLEASGIEEMLEDLAEIKTHDRGRIRVPITDIRRWYADYGALTCSINIRTRAGKFDRNAINPPPADPRATVAEPAPGASAPGSPWTFIEVLEFFLSQLPGSPMLTSWSRETLLSLGLAPPEDIIGEGEPIVEHLGRLLERNGLSFQLQPDGSASVNPRMGARYQHGQVPVQRGEGARPTPATIEDESYERKTVYLSDRPPAVTVIGRRVVKRVTMCYVPVLQDVDGKWYRMETLLTNWGYSPERLNDQIFNGQEKRFIDVPPSASAYDGGPLHKARREILKKAYRQYRPAFMFQGDGPVTEKDFEHLPFLPIRDCALLASESSARKFYFEGAAAPTGDDVFSLGGPSVSARGVTQAFFGNWDQVEDWFSSMQIELIRARSRISSAKATLTGTLQAYAETIKQASARLEAAAGNEVKVVSNGDITAAREALSGVGIDTHDLAEERMGLETWAAVANVNAAAITLSDYNDQSDRIAEEIGR